MKTSSFKKFRLGLIILVVILGGVAVSLNSVLVALLSVGGGMAILSLAKTTVAGTLEDERAVILHEKATRTAFKILMPILALTSVALVLAGQEGHYYLQALGLILGYVTIVGLAVYLLAYFYFSRKYGG